MDEHRERGLLTWVRRNLIRGGLVILLFSVMGTGGMAYGQGVEKPEWVMPEHYPNGFDGMGRIDRISIQDGEVVIDDGLMPLSPYARYHTPDSLDVSGYYFKAGMNVGYMMGKDDKIISMWLIEKR